MSTAIIGNSQLKTNRITPAEMTMSSNLFSRKKLLLLSIKLLAEKPLTLSSAGMVKGEMRVVFLDMRFLIKGLGSKGDTISVLTRLLCLVFKER